MQIFADGRGNGEVAEHDPQARALRGAAHRPHQVTLSGRERGEPYEWPSQAVAGGLQAQHAAFYRDP